MKKMVNAFWKDLFDKWSVTASIGTASCVFVGVVESFITAVILAVIGGFCIGRITAEARRKGR